MALPAITSYALPVAADLPPARAPWSLATDRAALLVHDMQRYFLRPFPADVAPMAPVLTHISALIAACHTAGVPVIFSAQPGAQDPRDRGLQRDIWGPGMSSDPADQSLAPAFQPTGDDLVLTKWRYSAFQRTNLAHYLRDRQRDQLIITGVYAHIGCQATATDAFMQDIQPFFIADAVADFSRAWHDQAVAWVAACCGVPMLTAAVLEQLRP